MGRLFDAAAALAGVRATVNYEAQAAIEFEAIADPGETGAYDFETVHQNGDNGYAGLIIDPTPVISQIVSDINAGVGIPAISARFHHGVAKVIAETAGGLARQHQITQIALSGGVWQNMTLLRKVCALLDQHGLEVLIHRQVPANDGGIALGQAVVAINQLMKP
jgi:hydrogenase maturation protein HypF